jgi:hypothetical protein
MKLISKFSKLIKRLRSESQLGNLGGKYTNKILIHYTMCFDLGSRITIRKNYRPCHESQNFSDNA